ncbi:DUF982 domain-containing protein [Rhizobium puerariae]|uniref:DUF982 domain-containing protein n=1 Tax=Rhizobium puerariae TaxID=1585791 RepID=A0ABV6AF97_9HYPH
MRSFDRRVFRPLRFEGDGSGYTLIDSVEDAIGYVTDIWPVRIGKAYEDALQACIDGISDRISPEQVRQILYESARSAGLHVGD